MTIDSKVKVSIVGLGYVGLPLALEICKSGKFKVVGIDKDSDKVKMLNQGKSPIEDISDSQVTKAIEVMEFKVSQDFSLVSDSKVIVVCVPTPLNSLNLPNLSYVESAAIEIAQYINKDTLVILESTVYPGATRNVFSALLEKHSKIPSSELNVAFSPERIDPGNKEWGVKNTPKLIAGLSSTAKNLAFEFYSTFINSVESCDTVEIAEIAKLLENSFRLINISFINELSIFCNQIGVDINKVINASSTKPYGFMPFYPSLGVGGHCIPIDPLYLASSARHFNSPLQMIELAEQINASLPDVIIRRSEVLLGSLNKKRILVIGIAYKPDVTDIREAPAEKLIIKLRQKGAVVAWHDDLVKECNGEKSVALRNEYDLAIIATPHTYLDLTKLGDMPILNTRGSI